jgi:AbrB family looped-hinge helix DNA binding protein
MNAQTKLSAKGQVVIPKDVRDRLHWTQGESLDVIETADGVLLKRPNSGAKLSAQEAFARIRARVNYDGPPVTIEEMDQSISEMFRTAKDERF